jgi:hypothetical protein
MGATDPIYTNTEPGTDLFVANITTALGLTLADRSGGGILANPVLAAQFQGRNRLLKALAANTVYVSWGVDKYLAVTQGNSFAITDLTSDKITVTPARMGYARQISDMFRSLDDWGLSDWANFVADGTIGWQQTVISTIAALFTTFSNTGGNTGGAASWGHVLADMHTLGVQNVEPPYVFITRPKDWASIETDIISLGGAVQADPETQRYLGPTNPGFKGVYMHGALWVYTSAECPVSVGDTVSGMFGRSALEWNAHMPAPSRDTNPLLWTPLFGIETDRSILKSDDIVAYSTHLGASIGQGYAGVAMPFVT